MSNNTLTYFIQNELKPRLFGCMDRVFPELEFRFIRGKWCSRKHYDGSEATHPSEDKSVVTPKHPDKVFDNARQDYKEVIDLYKELHNLSSTYDAVKELSKIVGLTPPQRTPEQEEAYRKQQERRTALELSAERQKAALFSPEGKETLSYMLSRGWNEAEIKAAELGFISKAEAEKIGAQSRIGTDYTLSIPLRDGGRLYGFKFRTISNAEPKYLYLTGTTKKENFFGLSGVFAEEKEIVIVEGELDALHAKVRGLSNIVATSGGGLTPEYAQMAKDRGAEVITLLMDKDKAGEKFIDSSIEAAREARLSVMVATLPDGTGKDIDEYLEQHTGEELKEIIRKAEYATLFLYHKLIEPFVETCIANGNINPSEEVKLRAEVIKLANRATNEAERDMILSDYNEALDNKITKEALQAQADRERAEERAQEQKAKTKTALREASSLYEEGKIAEALNLMKAASQELLQIDTEEKYADLLKPQNSEELEERLRHRKPELPTPYTLTSDNGRQEQLTFPSGALTLVCAPTSHGKSTLLQNLALQIAKEAQEGEAVLYFTFEEEGDNVVTQLLNKYMNYPLSANNRNSLEHYFNTGEVTFISRAAEAEFKKRKAEFYSSLYNKNKIRVFNKDYYCHELVGAIRHLNKLLKVKAVFIDYIQKLYIRNNRLQRREELREIAVSLENLAIETQLPIIVGAQLSREAASPIDMHSQNIAESADLERTANKVLCLWNSSYVAQPRKGGATKEDIEAFEEEKGFKLKQDGKIYMKLTKNRGGMVGIDGVFPFNGNTGVISPERTEKNSQPQTGIRRTELTR